MTCDTILALASFAFVTSITPGPNNIMLTAPGVNFGFRRSIPHMLGIAIGFMVLLLAVGFGLAKLVALPFGGVGTFGAVLLGLVIVMAVFAVLAVVGRRKQAKAKAARASRSG